MRFLLVHALLESTFGVHTFGHGEPCPFNIATNYHHSACDYAGCNGYDFWGCGGDDTCVFGFTDPLCTGMPDNYRDATPAGTWCFGGRRDARCPPRTSGGGTFTFHEGPISWEAALAACEAQGGSLASIHSESENAAAHAVTSGRRAYIGLNDRANEGSFVWADGTPVDFTRWGGSEPNSFAGSNEDCAGFHAYYSDGGWNDFMCSGNDHNGEPIGYVCSSVKPPPPPPSPPSPPSPPYDPDRGAGLPHCECNAYHNGAWQWMSRMCAKPWGDMNVCYPTRVVYDWSQGTFLNSRYYDNRCDEGQSMCSPWTPPSIASGSGSS